MKPTAEDLINGEISSVGVYLFNKVKNYIFEKEPIEKTAIRKADFEKIIEEEAEFEEFPAISQEDIKAICEILYNSDDIESIIKQLYVFQSGINKSLDEIKEDFVSLFPNTIKLENGKRNLETGERSSFLLKVFEVLDEGIQIALNRASNEGSSGALNALSNRRHFDIRNEVANGFKDVKKLISDSSRGTQEKKILAEKLPSLFISYAREDDEPFVEKLYRDLKEKGFEIWWDRAAMKNFGRTFLQEIRDAIEDSDLLIAVIGPKATQSDSVRYEWEHALLFSKGVIPILRMGDYKLLLPEMSKLHCPDFRETRPYKEALQELIRLLKEPIPPLGQMIGVPSLPPNHLPRKNDLNIIKEMILTDTVKPVVITSTKQVTVLQGMGGMGKSVLSTAFVRTAESRRAFHDGIFWITVGLETSESDASGNMRLIGTNLGDDPVNYSSKKEAEASLSKVLSDKVCLVVLDDVWKVSQATPFFNSLGSRCRLLITTRNDDVVISLGAQEHKIKVLSEPEALKLLANWCKKEVDLLPSEATEIARECGYLPLALSICGSMAKSGISWSDILEALQEADLEFIEAQLPNYPDPNVGRALKVSVDFLSREDPNAVLRYQELAIFPEDELVPETTITMLWEHTGNLKRRNVGKLLTKLKDRSLLRLDGEAPNRLISLHDLQFDYLKAKAGDLPNLHNQFLEAYSKKCGGNWSDGPNDGYFFEHLAYHMKEAGRKEELRKFLLDFEWMCTKLKKVCIINEKTGLEKPDVNSLLHDYDYFFDETEIRLVQDAIKLSFNTIVKDKTQLAGQLLGRLLCFQSEGIQSLLSQAHECRDSIRLLPMTSSLIPPGGQLIITFEVDYGGVWAVAVTPDGKYAVSASEDGTVRVLNLENGEEETKLKGHQKAVTIIEVTPDGKYAVSASIDGIIKVWDLKKKEEITTFKGHSGRVRAIAITPNGKYAVSASDDRTIKVWDLVKLEGKTTLRGHDSEVGAVAVTPDGNCVVSASDNGVIKVWDLEKREEKATLEGHSGKILSIAITADGKRVVSASDDRVIKVWDLEKGEEKITLKGHSGKVLSVAVTPDGKYAVSASADRTVKIWNLEKGIEKATLKGHNRIVTAIRITPDGKYAISASFDGTVKVWDLENEYEKVTLKGHDSLISGVVVTPDERYVISASGDGTVKVWDLERRDEKRILGGYEELVSAIAITPDGKHAVSTSFDGILKVWDLEKGEEKTKLIGHNRIITAIRITPDGKYAVSASEDRTVRIWDLENGTEKTTLRGHDNEVLAVDVTPDGRYAVSASFDGILKVWNLERGEEKITLKGHNKGVWAVAVTADGKCAVSASDDGVLKVWDLERGEEKTKLKGHKRVLAVTVTPDGRYAVSASGDGTVKVWDLEKGEEKTKLKGHDKRVLAVTITPDGRYAVSASEDRTVKLWDLEKEETISVFSGDSSFLTCNISPDGNFIVAGDALSKIHFLQLEKPD